ncbi:MAG: LamG domain-containing protein [Lachnospiraceae bacterium]|nr:LamG domain-containing protein [Lachnospiraceae bacterium]
MKKKVLSALLSGLLAVTMLAGCGKGADQPAPAPDAGTESSGSETASTPAADIPQDYKYYFSMDGGEAGVHKAARDSAATPMVQAIDDEVTYIPGVKGQAAYTDGVNGLKLDVNGVGQKYTVSFWVYAARNAQYMPTLQYGPDMHGDATGGQHYVNFTWASWNPTSDDLSYPSIWAYDQNAEGAPWPNWYADDVNAHTREWVNITMTVDPAETNADGTLIQAHLYMNGEELVGTDSEGNARPVNIVQNSMEPSDNYDFLLGINYWDATMKGAFDEVYIYDYVLSADQIKGLYAAGDTSVAFQEPERVLVVTPDEKATASLGTVDYKASLRGAFVGETEIKEGETYKVKLKNWSDGLDTKDNYAIAFGNAATDASDYKEYGLLYADASGEGWFEKAEYNYTWGNWNTWSQSSMVEADSTVTITREGDTLTVYASNVDYNLSPQDMTAVAKMSISADDPLFFAITNQNSYVDLLSVKNATITANAGLTLGVPEMTSAFWTEFTPVWAVPEGESRTIGFTNYTDGAENWDNFVVILQNTEFGHSADAAEGYAEYAVVRADNYGWGAGYDGVVTPECDWNWDTFKDDINGAHIDLTVTNNGDTADITFTARTTAGTEYHQSYTGIATGGDLYYCLSLEKAYLQFDSTVVGSMNLDAPFWNTFSDVWYVPEGGTKSISFRNYTAGENNWENFVAILQNVPAGHSADAYEGYLEYGVVRADNYGWGAGYDGIATAECDWNWDTFKDDINGADIDLTVVNNGDTADIHIVALTQSGAVYHQDYTGIQTGGDLYLTLTLEKAYLVMNGTTTGNVDNTTGWWTQHSAVKPVAKGETEYVTFTNFNDGADNWHNFVIVLQNTAFGHSAEAAEGYAEYCVVRADNFGWGGGYDGIVTPECDWNWDTFMDDMNGAHICAAITNNGDTADIVIYCTTVAGTVYTQKYMGITTGGDLYYCLGCENAHVVAD